MSIKDKYVVVVHLPGNMGVKRKKLTKNDIFTLGYTHTGVLLALTEALLSGKIPMDIESEGKLTIISPKLLQESLIEIIWSDD